MTGQYQTPNIIINAEGLNHRVDSGSEQLTLLKDINLQVSQGESVAIVGASGSGKTTLLSMLAGLDSPSEGEIAVCGANLKQLDEEQRATLRREKLGFIFQQFLLIPSLSALDNVMLAAQLRGLDDAKALAAQWLERVGLRERASHFPNQLSGGEQQRVAIARAFICQPEVLFADEPSANLDAENGHRIEELLFSLNQQLGTTLVLVTHDPSLAARCDRVQQMAGGALSEARP
ncbi:ABC transporter ATP-binding protein [Aliagarivorans marinus]|uniref:ABC transporter ATP-binding protein n=1 Tax=Aliagarivorans marinus TaxID=561965 RepID=UPI00040A6838